MTTRLDYSIQMAHRAGDEPDGHTCMEGTDEHGIPIGKGGVSLWEQNCPVCGNGSVTPDEPKPFYLCRCCEMYHPLDWWGDCRDNDNRYTPDDLDKEYGDGWVEVPQP